MSEARTSGGRRSCLTRVASWLLGALTLAAATHRSAPAKQNPHTGVSPGWNREGREQLPF